MVSLKINKLLSFDAEHGRFVGELKNVRYGIAERDGDQVTVPVTHRQVTLLKMAILYAAHML